ncbi:MAG: inorganic phosphate transporter [Ignavibacteriales bacterium]|nr:inorganic phosphate transporter [Ignavibacteriales bacterium]MBK7267595.1 inorganic phosphate transporter [Ignavibacteriales bacterium]MBK8664288.1 inorganic phosphate transporter [Ignavibacteriales bacterium]MBP7542072.1 inorganic phosphate transporter [Ignavibacteriaceae bacterium]MCC6636399.1 inorganic phosphate transporter [Ignavibacteriaceae bacterium]
MDYTLFSLIFIIFLALAFDFINGFHDAANSIATVVSTRVLSPKYAVIWAAFFNFIAFLVLGLHVANTIGKGIIEPHVVDLTVIGSGLTAAIIWNLATWWLGIPSSSSHTMIGGLVGAAITKAGFSAVFASSVFKIIVFIFIAPMIGIFVAYFFSLLVLYICRNFAPKKVDKVFRKLQLLSSAAYSLGHGSNDAQKMMGVIFMALTTTGYLSHQEEIPLWVVLSCHAAIALGTLSGGWRIVKTMGQKITKLRPFEGFTAETAGALTLFGTALMGIPVSTTHTITGSIIGSGITKRLSAVKWQVTYDLILAWVLTIPVTAIIASVIYFIFNLF